MRPRCGIGKNGSLYAQQQQHLEPLKKSFYARISATKPSRRFQKPAVEAHRGVGYKL